MSNRIVSVARGLAVILVSAAVGAIIAGTWFYLGVEAWEALKSDPPPRGGFDANMFMAAIVAASIGAALGAAAGIGLLAARPRWLDRLRWPTGPPAARRPWGEPLDLSSLPRYPGPGRGV
jgi:hypothetical protein